MKAIVTSVGCVLLFASAAVGHGRLSAQPAGDGFIAAAAGEDRGPRVSVTGSIEGLFPGARAPIALKISNRGRRPVRIRWVKAVVGDAGPDCLAANLQTHRRNLKKTVRRGTSIRAELQSGMLASAPDACQGTTFPLQFVSRVKTIEAGPR